MKLNSELKAAVEAGQRELADLDKIGAAIESGESAVPAAITKKLVAESALADIEAREALGQAKSGAGDKAKRALSEAREQLDAIAARVLGLRRLRDAKLTELLEAHARIEDHTVAFSQEAAREFEAEWMQAVQEFGKTLGRRAAIEDALGTPLQLPEPTPVSDEVAGADELALPKQILTRLELAARTIEQAQRASINDRRVPSAFDPEAVYEFRTAQRLNGRDYPAGARVLGSLLGEAAASWCLKNRTLTRIDLQRIAG